MREIKFRAWDKKLKHMRGSAIDDAIKGYKSFLVLDFWGQPMHLEHGIPARCSACGDVGPWTHKTITCGSNFIIMQYSGLKDKNGKEIYEGDILKTHFSTNEERDLVKILFRDGGFNAVALSTLDGDTNCLCPDNSLVREGSEVLGNIYENPELLNK